MTAHLHDLKVNATATIPESEEPESVIPGLSGLGIIAYNALITRE